MKTAEQIEQTEEAKAQVKYGRGKNPNSHTDTGRRNAGRERQLAGLIPWKPGQSGNPSGHAKHDFAAEIARAVFEKNGEAIYQAYSRALTKGNAYAFKEIADRAYGKLKERIELGDYRDVSNQTLSERVRQLERELGYADAIDEAGRTGVDQARTATPDCTPKD